MPTARTPSTRTFAQRVDDRIEAISRGAVELGRFLADIGIFAGTIVVVWGGCTWLGYALDRMFGTAPRVSVVMGQSGPFAMLGVISGMILSLFAANWVSNRRRRR
jgi:hypothetical protein